MPLQRDKKGKFIKQTPAIQPVINEIEFNIKPQVQINQQEAVYRQAMADFDRMEQDMKRSEKKWRWIWSIIFSVYVGWIIGQLLVLITK